MASSGVVPHVLHRSRGMAHSTSDARPVHAASEDQITENRRGSSSMMPVSASAKRRGKGDLTSTSPSATPREQLAPLIRWPGGKRWLAPRLIPLATPEPGARYFEPFFGGGALFFAMRPT